jgi:ribosomal protein S12 methylthiotransferase accessory factor YcaO
MNRKEIVQEQHRRQYHAQRRSRRNRIWRKSVPQRKKRKEVKEVATQALSEDDLEKIVDQVKEAIDEDFEHVTQKQEERHLDVQAQIVTL